MHRPSRFAAGAIALAMALSTSGCYGPFYLVRKVHKFNGEISDNKWVVEVAYIVMAGIIPVYGVAGLLDELIFNSIEFWTGENPVADAKAPTSGVQKTANAQPADYRAYTTANGEVAVSTTDGMQVASLAAAN